MISKDELLKWTEGKNIEFKKASTEIPKSFWETYSAFANCDGGMVIFGIDEEHNEITGVQDAYKMRNDLFTALNNPNKVSTNILSDENIKIIEFGAKKNILIIDIPEAPYNVKPIYINQNPRLAFERLGDGDMKLTPERYKQLVVGSHPETDNELLRGFGINDLDEFSLQNYRQALYEITQNNKYLNITFEDMLIEIGALRKDRQTNEEYHLTAGGLLFFGKVISITDRFPGFQLDYFEKESSLVTDWKDRITSGDNTQFEMNIYTFLTVTLNKLSQSIKDEFRLDEKSKIRLPFKSDLLTSVREALVNSLMHAYYDSNTPIKITAYNDYYEFINPGKMRVTVTEFMHGGISNIRNHTISSMMRRIGFSEKAGSGGPRIFDIATKYRLKLPEVIRDQDKTTIRIWKVDLKKIFENYPESQRKILNYLLQEHFISRSKAKKELEIDNYEFRTATNSLLKEGLIEAVGQGRSTKYQLKPSSLEHSHSLKLLLRKLEDSLINIEN